MKVLFIQSNVYMSKIQNNVCCICIVLLQCSVGSNYACSDFFGRFNVQFLGNIFKVRKIQSSVILDFDQCSAIAFSQTSMFKVQYKNFLSLERFQSSIKLKFGGSKVRNFLSSTWTLVTWWYWFRFQGALNVGDSSCNILT